MRREAVTSYLTVVGAFVIHLVCGNSYVFGVINSYLSSYLRFRAAHNGTDLAQTEYISAFNNMAFGVGPIMAGLIVNRIGQKNTLIIGSFVALLGMGLTYFTIKVHYMLAVLTAGFVGGIGGAFLYTVSIVICQQHFPERSGLVTGIVLMGDSCASLLYNPILSFYVNPKNEKPNVTVSKIKYFDEDDILNRVPNLFIIIAGIGLVLSILALILIKEYKRHDSVADREILINNDHQGELDSQCILNENEPEKISSFSQLKEVLTTYNFYLLWISMFAFSMNLFLMINNWKEYGQNYIDNDQLFGILSILIAIFLVVGRIVFGMSVDRFQFKYVLICMCFAESVVSAALPAFQFISNTPLRIIYFIFMLGLQFLVYGGFFSVISIPLGRMFGLEHLNMNYGLILSTYIITPFLGDAILKPLLNWKGMMAVWLLSAFNSLMVTIMNLTFVQY